MQLQMQIQEKYWNIFVEIYLSQKFTRNTMTLVKSLLKNSWNQIYMNM